MQSMTVELRPGDTLRVGSAVIRFEHKSGKAARLNVAAPQDVEVGRHINPNHGKTSSEGTQPPESGERRSAPGGQTKPLQESS